MAPFEQPPAGWRPVQPSAAPICAAAEAIAGEISFALSTVAGGEDTPVDVVVIQSMLEGAFWSGTKGRLFLLNEDETLLQFMGREAWTFLCRRFGSPVEMQPLIAKVVAAKRVNDPDEAEKVEAAVRKAMVTTVAAPILNHLKYANQREQVEWAVDMFATRSRMELTDDCARIVLTHRAMDEGEPPDLACIADYKEHFPLLDDTLGFFVAARFALDRKKAYLWLLAPSDWGKGFFMGALSDLGLVVEMSVKEIEGVFEGKPSSIAAEKFRRAHVLAVDEFKAVKAELKQLQSTIALAPKFQLKSRVEIFTKLFLSAESVASLVSEYGVEDQFANRMSMIVGTGTLNGRAVYVQDQGLYYRSVRDYIARTLNRHIAAYQAMGREAAEKAAGDYLVEFIGKHGIDQHYTRLSDNYPKIAAGFIRWAGRRFENDSLQRLKTDWKGNIFLTDSAKALEDYLSETYSRSEVGTLNRRRVEILAAASEDGRGSGSHRFKPTERLKGVTIRAVKLKDLAEFELDDPDVE